MPSAMRPLGLMLKAPKLLTTRPRMVLPPLPGPSTRPLAVEPAAAPFSSMVSLALSPLASVLVLAPG